MKISDIFFAIVSGFVTGWVAREILEGYGVEIGFLRGALLHYALPALFLLALWIAEKIGRKFLFVFQAAKHLIVGAFATVVDLKLFEFFVWTFAFFFPVTPVLPKAVSFLFSTLLKYWGNKKWAFEHHENGNLVNEFLYFFVVTAVGMVVDLVVFYYLVRIIGSQLAIPVEVWLKLSVIIAGAAAAVWNFTAYKFLVFKK